MTAPFADIMRRAVEAVPGAVGGAFADSEGEMVGCFSTVDKHDWAVLTATYGVVMNHLQHAFGTWHYGGAEYFIAQHAEMDVLVFSVAHGYFALLGLRRPGGTAPLGAALAQLHTVSAALRKEIA